MTPVICNVRRSGWAALVALAAAGACTSGRAEAPGRAESDDRVARRSVEDVFLLTGELTAVGSTSIVTPRTRGSLQIRWLAEDGSEVRQGDRLVDFDASNLIQTIEDKRLQLEQATIAREAAERNTRAEAEKKRVAVDKAEIEAEKARIDAEVPREMRPAAEWRKFQATWHEKRAALEKARLEQEAYAVAARSEIESARAAEEKARRELVEFESGLDSMSIMAPRNGIFFVGDFYNWGPEGPRKLQPGDRVWPSYPIGKIQPGMKARCILDTYPHRAFAGTVEEVGSVTTQSGPGWDRTKPGFPVRVSLERTDPLMRPGLSVRVEVVRGVWDDALVVPRGAVRFEKEGPVVRPEGGGDPVPVSLAACTPTACVVEEGLEEGDRVPRF